MNWKKFLKPNREKIVLLILIIFISILYISSGAISDYFGREYTNPLNPIETLILILLIPTILIMLPYGYIQEYISNPSLASSHGINPMTISLIILFAIIGIFIWYVIVCLLSYIYKRYRYKKPIEKTEN